MTPESFLKRLANLKLWKRGRQRAPHKPLLLLLALARVRRGESRLQPFAEIEGKLTELLRQFGRPVRDQSPEQPFFRLSHDGGIWETPGADQLKSKAGDITARALRDGNIAGGFRQELYDALRNDDALLCRAAEFLLENEFPRSYHKELLEAIGFDDPGVLYQVADSGRPEQLEVDIDDPGAVSQVADASNARQRDPKFREKVITAYERRCAVCNYDIRIADQLLGLEAAHILWHSRGGPDEVRNGLALCTLHHTALDRGGISVDDDMKVLVSPQLHGHDAAQIWFLEYEGKKIRDPRDKRNRPNPDYLEWHRREVFRRPLD